MRNVSPLFACFLTIINEFDRIGIRLVTKPFSKICECVHTACLASKWLVNETVIGEFISQSPSDLSSRGGILVMDVAQVKPDNLRSHSDSCLIQQIKDISICPSHPRYRRRHRFKDGERLLKGSGTRDQWHYQGHKWHWLGTDLYPPTVNYQRQKSNKHDSRDVSIRSHEMPRYDGDQRALNTPTSGFLLDRITGRALSPPDGARGASPEPSGAAPMSGYTAL
jgi:hypothetical protein